MSDNILRPAFPRHQAPRVVTGIQIWEEFAELTLRNQLRYVPLDDPMREHFVRVLAAVDRYQHRKEA